MAFRFSTGEANELLLTANKLNLQDLQLAKNYIQLHIYTIFLAGKKAG